MQAVGPILFSYALFYTAQCLLNHPFLLYQQSKSRGTKPPASFLSRALQSGKENAFMMSTLLSDAEALGCSIRYSFVGYCTTVCAGIHTMYLNDRNAETRQQARKCLDAEKNFLEQYAQTWKNGKIMVRLLSGAIQAMLTFPVGNSQQACISASSHPGRSFGQSTNRATRPRRDRKFVGHS